MKFRMTQPRLFWLLSGMLTLVFFQNCSQQYGVAPTDLDGNLNGVKPASGAIPGSGGQVSLPAVVIDPTTGSNAEADGSAGVVPSTPVVQVPSETTPPQPVTHAVCDPLSQPGSAGSKPGIQAQIFALSASEGQGVSGVRQYFLKTQPISDTLVFLSQLNVPTRAFTSGFTGINGEVLKNSQGEKLIEYFALKMETRLRLGADDADGLYQLGMLSDDGSVVEVNTGKGFVTLVDNDGNHPTKMKCGGLVEMKKGVSLPARILYYQGPRHHIAATLLWRKVDAGANLSNPNFCDVSGNDVWFDSTQTPSKPQRLYSGLIQQGWSVLKPQNFEAVSDLNQSCQ